MNEILNKGEYYTTIKNGECFADVYKPVKANYIYIVDLFQEGRTEQLTTAVCASRYRKELDKIFFDPMASELWNIHGVFEAIRRDRVTA